MSLVSRAVVGNHGGGSGRPSSDCQRPGSEVRVSFRTTALALIATVLVAGCATGGSAATPRSSSGDPAAQANQGNIGATFPELTVERNPGGSLHVAVTDPEAKAWRLVVHGLSDRADDALELVAEVGDVELTVTVREIDGYVVVDELDLTGLGRDGTAATGGCHRTLPVCFASGGMVLPGEGSATFGVDLALLDPDVPLEIGAATATWSGEPFVLGPWRETRPFVTTEG